MGIGAALQKFARFVNPLRREWQIDGGLRHFSVLSALFATTLCALFSVKGREMGRNLCMCRDFYARCILGLIGILAFFIYRRNWIVKQWLVFDDEISFKRFDSKIKLKKLYVRGESSDEGEFLNDCYLLINYVLYFEQVEYFSVIFF